MGKQGQKVRCGFTLHKSDDEVLADKKDPKSLLYRELEVRRFFAVAYVAGQPTPQPVIARALADPGELTQGLCSPWQNDYRECACYYWAASRPDYVNVADTADGETRGDNWMGKITKTDARLITSWTIAATPVCTATTTCSATGKACCASSSAAATRRTIPIARMGPR